MNGSASVDELLDQADALRLAGRGADARLLYDQAVILEGSKVKDPLALARRINELMLAVGAT